jgi:hypothetical protein
VGRAAFQVVASAWLAAGALQAQAALPRTIETALSASYPGWRFARVDSTYRVSMLSGGSAAWITGDFDGDARADYAVQIVAPSGADSVQRVVAFMRRHDGYLPIPVQGFPVSGFTYLLRARRGEERMNFDADPNGDARERLPHDAIDLIYAEVAASTCLWESERFRCITTGD